MVAGHASGRGQGQFSEVHSGLTELLYRLEQIEAVVSVASAALKHQNCEKDDDVARVLQRDVGDRISTEAERVRLMLRQVEPVIAKANKGARGRKSRH